MTETLESTRQAYLQFIAPLMPAKETFSQEAWIEFLNENCDITDAQRQAWTPLSPLPDQITAGDVAGCPELFNLVYTLPGSRKQWECTGYTRTGYYVRFARLVPLAGMRLRVATQYLKPDVLVTPVSTNQIKNDV